MLFVGQIDLGALHERVGETLLPERGFLWFFINRFHFFSGSVWMKQEANKLSEDDGGALLASLCAVIYADVEGAALTIRPYPEVGEVSEEAFLETHSERQVQLDFEHVQMLPFPPSAALPPELDTEEMVELTRALAHASPPGDHLLGHLSAGDHVAACGPEDCCLLRITPRNGAGFCFGDSTDLYFVIPADDLAHRRFDRAKVFCGIG